MYPLNTLTPLAKPSFRNYALEDLDLIADHDASTGVNARGAVNLASSSSQYLTYNGVIASFPFSVALWIRPNTLAGTVFGQFSPTLGSHGNYIFVTSTSVIVSSDQRDGGYLSNTEGPSFVIEADQWYFVVAVWESDSSRMLSVNAGDYLTNAEPITAQGTMTNTNFGVYGANGAGFSDYFDGALDNPGIWNRVLSQSEITQLYNGGSGLSYSELDSGLLDGLVAWHEFEELSGNRNDSVNSYDLTPVNSPTAIDGKVEGPADDLDPANLWVSTSNLTQDTISSRPTYRTDGYVDFDGTDDHLDLDSTIVSNQSNFTQFIIVNADSLASSSNERVIYCEEADDATVQYRISIDDSGNIVVKYKSSGATLATLTSAATLSTATPYTICVRRSGALITLFVDGEFDAETSCDSGATMTGATLSVGSYIYSTNSQAFDGRIYRIASIAKALNNRAIRQISSQISA